MERYEAEKDGEVLTAELSDTTEGKIRLIIGFERIGQRSVAIQVTTHDTRQDAIRQMMDTFGSEIQWYRAS